MTLRIVSTMSLAAVILIGLSGCQSGKLNMPGLAFWKKNDRLSPEYIEPPSHNFTPGETDIADSVDVEIGTEEDGPPKRPIVSAEQSSESLESFAAEVNRSWEQLAEKSQEDGADHAGTVKQAMVDQDHVSMPPTREVGPADFANPLAPRQAPGGGGQFAAGSAEAENPSSASGFQPATNYEKLAAQTMGSSRPAPRYEMSPAALSQNGSGSPLVPETVNSPETVPNEAGENVRMLNPYSGPAGDADIASSPISAPASSTPAQPQYETTPYKPFGSDAATEMADPSATTSPQLADNSMTPSASPGEIPSMLQLSGQGSYAPGSVRRPEPIQPESMTVPHTATGGGSFQR